MSTSGSIPSSNSITLSATGQRALVSVAEAEQILEQWKEQINNPDTIVRTLDLSCRAWQVATLRVFADLFHSIVPTVQVLLLDDVIASLPTDDGLDTLEWLANLFSSSPLQILELSDNAIGTRGMERLTPLLQVSTLQTIRLNNCGLSAEAIGTTFLECMTSALDNRRLKGLALSRNQIGPDGAEKLAILLQDQCCEDLQLFEYCGSRPLKRGTLAICQALAKITSKQVSKDADIGLQVLDLDDCHFGNGELEDDPVHVLCQIVENAPHLTKLVLNDGGLEADGLMAVVQALQASVAKLAWLDLGAIDCGPDGAQALADFLKQPDCPLRDSLRLFKLDTNALTDEGLATLLPVLSQCHALETLNLAENELSLDGLNEFLNHKIKSLKTLLIQDNIDEDEVDDDDSAELLNTLRKRYPVVQTTEDGGHDDKLTEQEQEVDSLTAAMQSARIN